jgi:hypothetical protein
LGAQIIKGEENRNIPLPEKRRSIAMKKLRLMVLAVTLVVFGMTGFSMGAEYYVIKSQSGLLNVVDHQPKGGATVVKGPFGSTEEADKAMNALKGTSAPTAKPEGSGAPPTK